MYPVSWLCQTASANPPSQEEQQALLARARLLQQGTEARRPMLLGKRLGLMCADAAGPDAQRFLQAAQELGAHVALIPAPAGPPAEQAQQLAGIGCLLGRLYDAVDCQGLGPAAVERLAAAGNIPMYAGLACREHRIFGLAQQWDVTAPLRDRWRWLVQAALLATLV